MKNVKMITEMFLILFATIVVTTIYSCIENTKITCMFKIFLFSYLRVNRPESRGSLSIT